MGYHSHIVGGLVGGHVAPLVKFARDAVPCSGILRSGERVQSQLFGKPQCHFSIHSGRPDEQIAIAVATYDEAVLQPTVFGKLQCGLQRLFWRHRVRWRECENVAAHFTTFLQTT